MPLCARAFLRLCVPRSEHERSGLCNASFCIMKLMRLSGILVIIAVGQPTPPVSAKSEGSVRQESRAGTFTARELDGLVPTPRPEDVASPKALVVALHASISGPKGRFDWSRFRSLF